MLEPKLRNKIQELLESQVSFAVVRIAGKKPRVILPESSDKFTITPWLGKPIHINGNHCNTMSPRVEKGITDLTHSMRVSDLISVLREGNKVNKVVLSRIFGLKAQNISWVDVANELWETYPHAFGYLFYTPETGAWLGATPETLLQIKPNGMFYTHALAGTIRKGEKWDEKNREEHEMVADFIAEKLTRHAIKYSREKRDELVFGDIVHLCTVFHGELSKDFDINDLLKDMAPTPAVAGLPKDEAIETINNFEDFNRGCYGGYMTLESEGGSYSFVTLRCVNFNPKTGDAAVYAGGGITAKSDAEAEVAETHRKTEKILQAIHKFKHID